MINTGLKAELIRKFGRQSAAAVALGMREGRLSWIVTGRAKPNENETEAIKAALGDEVASQVLPN